MIKQLPAGYPAIVSKGRWYYFASKSDFDKWAGEGKVIFTHLNDECSPIAAVDLAAPPDVLETAYVKHQSPETPAGGEKGV